MKQKRFLLLRATALAALLAGQWTVAAAQQYGVSATVIGPDNEPESYATYRIYAVPDTLRPVVGDLAGDDGVINATLPGAGNYRLTISAVMRLPLTVDFALTPESPQADLGILNTAFAGQTLKEVTVTAQRPLVTKEIDRIGYDVNADSDASTSTLREILRKVPLVTVDDDGAIKVNGSDNFKIYRNGRPNNAFTKNAKDIFAAIPASSIRKIEVITDPGAREDAESSGVILNIVTNSTASMSGVTGNVGLNWTSNQGPNVNAFIMTQARKLTISGSGGYYKYLKSQSYGDTYGTINYLESGNSMETDTKFRAGGQGGWFNVEGSLEIDTMNLLTASVNGFIGKNEHELWSTSTMRDKAATPLYSFEQNSYYPKNGYTDIDFSLDYQHSTRLKGETLTLSYRLSHTRQDMDQKSAYKALEGSPFAYSSILQDFDLKFFEHTFQFDWSRPLGKHYNLDTGAKYILRTSHSNNHQTIGFDNASENVYTVDEFEHTYHIFGVFADMRATFGKWSVRAGLRYEYSRLGADFIKGEGTDFHSNLNDLVPNASVAWNYSQASTWKVSYSRRIQRPGISYLNPAVTVSPTTVSYGNPDLESTTINNILLNYSLIRAKFNMDLTATLSLTNDGTGAVQWTDNNILYSTYANLMHNHNFAFAAFVQWQMTPKTSLMLNGNVTYGNYKISTPSEYSYLDRWNGYFFLRLQQRLPWDITLSVNANYFSGWCSSPYAYSTSSLRNIGYGVGLKKTFLKNKTLDVSITANGVGMPNRMTKSYTLNNGTTGYQESYMRNRAGVTIGVSWRFGSLRTMVKKAAKTINNDDLQGRKN